jgi:hypothetical protein
LPKNENLDLPETEKRFGPPAHLFVRHTRVPVRERSTTKHLATTKLQAIIRFAVGKLKIYPPTSCWHTLLLLNLVGKYDLITPGDLTENDISISTPECLLYLLRY